MIMMTAHGTLDDAVAALRLGAAEFLRKPFRMAELEQVVRRTLREAQARRQQGREQPEQTERTAPAIPDVAGCADAKNPARFRLGMNAGSGHADQKATFPPGLSARAMRPKPRLP